MKPTLFRLAILAGVASALPAADLYVSTDGCDTWSGSLADANATRSDGPFATLERARDEIRQRRAAGTARETAIVHVRGGHYSLAQPLKLDARDSGTAAAPVVWCAYRDEHPQIRGGKPIADFIPFEGKILQTNVGEQGFNGVYFRMLLCDDRQQILARYPNFDPQNPYGGGFAYVPGEHVDLYKEIPGEDKRTLRYAPSDDRVWSNPGEAEVMVFPRYNWWNNLVPIASLDRATRTIKLGAD
jgi:hypothetical protein